MTQLTTMLTDLVTTPLTTLVTARERGTRGIAHQTGRFCIPRRPDPDPTTMSDRGRGGGVKVWMVAVVLVGNRW